MAEDYVKTLKREGVALGDLRDVGPLREQLPRWFDHDNVMSPHSALKIALATKLRGESYSNEF
jgi:hypothetical protein